MPPRKKAATAPAGEGAATPTGKTGSTPTMIEVPRLNIQEMILPIVGDSSLIMHKWSAKAKQTMLDQQMKKGRAKKEAKDPERDYLDSMYVVSGEAGKPGAVYGFPVVAFKAAAVNACSHVDGVTKVEARGAFHITGVRDLDGNECAVIEGEPVMREDMVRVGMGTADIRFRGEFVEWGTKLHIRYNATVLSAEQIVNLFNTAGFAIGVGEWRPQKNGPYGLFHVATNADLARTLRTEQANRSLSTTGD